MNYDFTLQPGSPLAERAHELPSFELDAQTRSDLMAWRTFVDRLKPHEHE